MYENNYDEEEWKSVVGFEGLYEVSSYGRIRSIDRVIMRSNNTILTLKGSILPQYEYYGNSTISRLKVNLSKNGNKYSRSVHRLVATAFIPNPDNLPQVNHKDENPKNNNVSNLEWCTCEYNHNYGTRNERHKKALQKRVNVYDLSGNYIKQYESIKHASEDLNLDPSSVTKVCKGKYRRHKTYIFRYA